MATKEMTINGVTVEVSQPYEAGHQITEAEAKALNQVRAENIGNNTRKSIKDMLEAADGDATAIQADVQDLISKYDAEYEFTLASVGGGSTSRLDPLTKECRSIARNFIVGKLKEQGISQKDYLEANGENAIKDKVVELADHPKIVEAAKKALAEREAMAGIELAV
jgi:hypothetical protein